MNEANRIELDKQVKVLADLEAKAEAKASLQLILCPNCGFRFATKTAAEIQEGE